MHSAKLLPHSATQVRVPRVALLRATAPTAAPVQSPQRSAPGTRGTVQYVKPCPEGGELYTYLYDLPEGVDKPTNMEQVETEVSVTDLHSVPQDFSLQRNGFQLMKFQVPDDINWDHPEQVEERYYPLAEKLIKEVTGATRVHIFDNTVRRGRVRPKSEEQAGTAQARGQPVARVHVDYTTKSGPERLKALLPDEVEVLKQTPFAVVQLWRPLRGPLQNSPLGMIDASTVAKEDYQSYTLHFPGRVGYNYAVSHNPEHRWYYTKDMHPDEAYIFVCYDSRADGRARFTPHTGFLDHNTPADAPPRESIELRSYCFWQDAPKQQPAMEL